MLGCYTHEGGRGGEEGRRGKKRKGKAGKKGERKGVARKREAGESRKR